MVSIIPAVPLKLRLAPPLQAPVKPFCPYAAGSGRFYLRSLSSFRLRSDSCRSLPAAHTIRRVSEGRDPDALSFNAFNGSLRFSPLLVNVFLYLFCTAEYISMRLPERSEGSSSEQSPPTMPGSPAGVSVKEYMRTPVLNDKRAPAKFEFSIRCVSI